MRERRLHWIFCKNLHKKIIKFLEIKWIKSNYLQCKDIRGLIFWPLLWEHLWTSCW
jgi:hypothetical protein